MYLFSHTGWSDGWRAARRLKSVPARLASGLTIATLTLAFMAPVPVLASTLPARDAQTTSSGVHDGELLDLPERTELGLADLLASTRQRHPQAGMLIAARRRADAVRYQADRWIAGASSLSAFHIGDGLLDDNGFYEDEIALSLPLWLPGEKAAHQRHAETLEQNSQSRAAAWDWQLSGEVRSALWRVIFARNEWRMAGKQAEILDELMQGAERLEEAGDIAEGDRLAVAEEQAAWASHTIEKEAEYQDAVRYYRTLTGADALPAEPQETLSVRQELGEAHPALLDARDRLAAARLRMAALEESSGIRPAVQLFWRGTRPDRNTPRTDALGVGLEVPLGRSPARRILLAELDLEMAEAEARLLGLQRDLQMALHEAEHRLHTAERRLEAAAARLNAAEQRRSMDRLALELGELSTQEWLRRFNGWREAKLAQERLLIEQAAATAAYNQAVGESL